MSTLKNNNIQKGLALHQKMVADSSLEYSQEATGTTNTNRQKPIYEERRQLWKDNKPIIVGTSSPLTSFDMKKFVR